jgi:protein-S-isoprenylcysteine O-methyltransferase Ste14
MSPFISLVNPAWTPDPWSAVWLSLMILAFAPSEVIYRRHGNITSADDRHSSGIILTSTFVTVGAFILFCSRGIGAITWHPHVVSIVGLTVTALGVALRYWAIVTLGRFFTSAVMVQADQPVVAHGPFRFIRHPGYAGALFFGVGAALTCANGAAAIFFVLCHGSAFRYRVKLEEAVMLSHFGQTYANYQARTWRFLPFVY